MTRWRKTLEKKRRYSLCLKNKNNLDRIKRVKSRKMSQRKRWL